MTVNLTAENSFVSTQILSVRRCHSTATYTVVLLRPQAHSQTPGRYWPESTKQHVLQPWRSYDVHLSSWRSLLSDILCTSTTCTIRNTWRFFLHVFYKYIY